MGLTKQQSLRAGRKLDALGLADRSAPLYVCPGSGWRMHVLTCMGDVEREGRLMHNCLQGVHDSRWDEQLNSWPIDLAAAGGLDAAAAFAPPPSRRPALYGSVRDHLNHPHMTFLIEDMHEAMPNLPASPYVGDLRGHGNAAPSIF